MTEWRFRRFSLEGDLFWLFAKSHSIWIELISLNHASCSGEFIVIFRFCLAWIFPQFLFERLSFLLFRKLLFFYKDSFGVFLGLVYLHLIIDLLHKHHFRFSLFRWLFTRFFLLLEWALSLCIHSPSPLPIHFNITLYPYKMKIFQQPT